MATETRLYYHQQVQAREKKMNFFEKKDDEIEDDLSVVVGWPAIFAPGYHTSRNHPARKRKNLKNRCTRLGTSPAIEDDFLLMLQHSTCTIEKRRFGNNLTFLYLNRPFISLPFRLLALITRHLIV